MKADWKPIETAPKDGQWLLVFSKWSGVEKSVWCEGEWGGNIHEHYDVTHWDWLPDGPES